MKRLLFLTWVAIGVIAWRQESLEAATSEFIALANKMLQTAASTMEGQMRDAVDSIIERGSMN